MDRLGAKQRNTVWAWCAVNEDERKVYLSLWSDMRSGRDGERTSYVVQESWWGMESGAPSPARLDHDEKLAKVFDDEFAAFGYVIEAEDPEVQPRSIATIKTSFVFELELERQDDGTVLGYLLSRIEVA